MNYATHYISFPFFMLHSYSSGNVIAQNYYSVWPITEKENLVCYGTVVQCWRGNEAGKFSINMLTSMIICWFFEERKERLNAYFIKQLLTVDVQLSFFSCVQQHTMFYTCPIYFSSDHTSSSSSFFLTVKSQ